MECGKRQTDQHDSSLHDVGSQVPDPCFLATPWLWIRVKALRQASEMAWTFDPLDRSWPSLSSSDTPAVGPRSVSLGSLGSAFLSLSIPQMSGRLLLELLAQVPKVWGPSTIGICNWKYP